MKRNLTQLNRLEEYLKSKGIPYERKDQEDVFIDGCPYCKTQLERHQIVVPNKENYEWDAICHYGSYGAEEGLLEIMGTIVRPNAGDSVEGYLTADDVIERIEEVTECG